MRVQVSYIAPYRGFGLPSGKVRNVSIARSGVTSKSTGWPEYVWETTAIGGFQIRPPSSLRATKTPLLDWIPGRPRSPKSALVSAGCGPLNVAAMKLTNTCP